MDLTLKIWRQKNGNEKGSMCVYAIKNIEPDMSFLEMLDVLNQELINDGKDLKIGKITKFSWQKEMK